ncbi:CopD family protein [Paenibacillus sp. PL2-23]|uniref:copper resistance D family protein n=1 Tax=Paenibacillus sp. PL2-23 TaxID=2100729 RepID=UPI0030FBFD52
MTYISEALLYVCFAILTGSLLLRLVPERSRPPIHVPGGLLIACAAAIPVLSFMPIHQLASLYADEFELTYIEMLRSILLDVNAGKAWIWTALGSAGLLVLLGVRAFRSDKHMPKVALFVTMLLVIWLGYASHASSLSSIKGLVVHSAHFLAFTVWIGILFAAGWFGRSGDNWPAFLRWFSPLAIVCVVVTLLAGLTLMSMTTPQYVNSWMLPYGQALLIKHLLIVPLLLFAYTNGFLYKAVAIKNPDFNPLKWLRVEGSFALLVLAATAFMGQQAPPHTVKETLQTTSPSSFFTWLYKGAFSPDLALRATLQTESVLMLAAAALVAAGAVWSYRLDRPWIAWLLGLLVTVFAYMGLMFMIA